MTTSPATAAEHLLRRRAAAVADARTRGALLRSGLAEARRTLTELGARRVVLFGSLARGDEHAESDVDLWVEGLPAGRQFEALSRLMHLLGTRVDLVRGEEAPASLAERVAAEGVVL